MQIHVSHTSKVMMALIGCICLLFLIAGLLVIRFIYPFEKALPFALGMTIGCFHSLLKVLLLEKSIDRTLDMEKDQASNAARLHALGRFVLTVAIFGMVVVFPRVFGLFGTILGVLSLQFAAFVTGVILH